jgi:hypothetical protein
MMEAFSTGTPMPITALTGSASLTPAHSAQVTAPKPMKAVTAAPFTPQAQKQSSAINTGRDPHRGHVVDIKA